MNKTDIYSFKKGDFLAVSIVLSLIVLCGILFVPRPENQSYHAEIYLDGEKIHVLYLDKDSTYTVSGEYTNVISVQNGKVSIIESSCPGGDCMRTGAISSAGRSIVCLPNRLEIRLTGYDDVDFVVR